MHGTNASFVAYGNGIFLVSSQNGVIRSEDGVHWSAVTVDPSLISPPIGQLVFNGVQFLFVKQGGFEYRGYLSANGSDWVQAFKVATWVVSQVVPAGDRFALADTFVQSAGFMGELRQFDSFQYQPFAAIAADSYGITYFTEDGQYGFDSPPLNGDYTFGLIGDPVVKTAIRVGEDIFLPGGGGSRFSDRYLPPQLWNLGPSGNLGFNVLPPISRAITSVASDGKESVVAVGDGILLRHRLSDPYFDSPEVRVDHEGQDLVLCFYRAVTPGYRLMATADLVKWEPALDPRTGNPVEFFDLLAGMQEWRIAIEARARFYRVEQGGY